MQKIVIATYNKHKMQEIKQIFSPFCLFEFITLEQAGMSEPVIEDGNTFAENALIKARAAAKALSLPAIADDSGLVVDYLNGDPGIHSARYASENGENSSDEMNIQKLLKNLGDIPKQNRTARFVCAAAYVEPSGKEIFETGTYEGYITSEKRGNGGFGYDPVFFSPLFGKTFGEISEEEKNKNSHRAVAITRLAKRICALTSKL